MYQTHRSHGCQAYLLIAFSLIVKRLNYVPESCMTAYEVHRACAFHKMSTEARLDLRKELISYAHSLQPEKRLVFLKKHQLLSLADDDTAGTSE